MKPLGEAVSACEPSPIERAEPCSEAQRAPHHQRERPARKKVPVGKTAVVLRTDFSDDAKWKAICAAIAQESKEGFVAYVELVEDRSYEGLTSKEVRSVAETPGRDFIFVVDRDTIANDEMPILVMDLAAEPGRTFRVIPSEMWAVENNLSLANMNFEEFAEAAAEDGVFRGFV